MANISVNKSFKAAGIEYEIKDNTFEYNGEKCEILRINTPVGSTSTISYKTPDGEMKTMKADESASVSVTIDGNKYGMNDHFNLDGKEYSVVKVFDDGSFDVAEITDNSSKSSNFTSDSFVNKFKSSNLTTNDTASYSTTKNNEIGMNTEGEYVLPSSNEDYVGLILTPDIGYGGITYKILGINSDGNFIVKNPYDKGAKEMVKTPEEVREMIDKYLYSLKDENGYVIPPGIFLVEKENAIDDFIAKNPNATREEASAAVSDEYIQEGTNYQNQVESEKEETIENYILKGELANKLNECLGNEGEKAKEINDEYNSYKSSFDQLTSTMNSLQQSGKWKDTGDIVVKDLEKRYDTLKQNLEKLEKAAKAKNDLKEIKDKMNTFEENRKSKIQERKTLQQEIDSDLAGHRPEYDSSGKKISDDGNCNGKCKDNPGKIASINKEITDIETQLTNLSTQANNLIKDIEGYEGEIKDYDFKTEIKYLNDSFATLSKNEGSKKKTPRDPGSPGGGNDGGDGAQQPLPAPVPITIPDMTADQIKIYEAMSIEEIQNLTDLLQSYANYKGITLSELLKDAKYQTELIQYLVTSNSLPEKLKQSIIAGDPDKTFALLSSIYSGGQPSIVGINQNTKKTLATYLNDVADSNNLTFNQLISSNPQVLKTALSKFSGVTNNITSAKDQKKNFIDIYDGNDIDNLEEETVSIERIYGDVVADSQNKDIESYFDSKTLDDDFNTLGKFSVFSNTVSNYDNESIRSVVYSMFS